MIEKKAYAKINLTLEVGDKRPDGYHLLTSVMARITLADLVRVSERESGIAFCSTDKTIPQDSNLCTRIAEGYFKVRGLQGGAEIFLENHIPTASGMGGGSADAAAVLEALEELYGRLDGETRHSLALSIGADVPYCLEKKPCLCTGIGDICTPLKCASLDGLWLTVSKKGEKLSTGKVYSDLDAIEKESTSHDHNAVIKALEKGDVRALATATFNDFERVVLPSSPEVEAERERLLEAGAINVTMSGAGPTLIAFFDDEEKARKCGEAWKLIIENCG